MTPTDRRSLRLELLLERGAELEALEQAILRARAGELSEVRRLQVRVGVGYGDASSRTSMSTEGDRARLRYEMLDRLLEQIKAASRGDQAT